MRCLAKLSIGSCALAALALVAGGYLAAGEKGAKVKVGDKAPAFESKDEAGKTWTSKDHVGKKIIVLYFYPADFTGGCTAQACGYRDAIEKAGSKGVEIVGVSGDTPATHKMFKKDFGLPFTLLADENGDIAKKFGVPVGKGGKATGKTSKGEPIDVTQGVRIQRWTVVIDKAGTVAAIDQVGKAGDDAKRVADVIKGLEKK